MKKILVTLVALSLTVTSAFSKSFFEKRFFEVIADVPVQVSNNYLKISDFQKDNELVIDLRQMADTLPASGYRIIAAANPEVGFNINAGPVSTGLFAGLDVYGNIGIGKELFDLLGYGNTLNKDIVVDADAVIDTFLTAKAPITVDIRRVRCTLQSNLFIPIINANASNVNATVKNTTDGRFIIDAKGNVAVNTILDYNLLMNENGGLAMDPSVISGILTQAFMYNAVGFDISGSFDYRLSDMLMLTSNFSIPLRPGKLLFQTPVTVGMGYDISLMDALSKQMSEPEYSFEKGECSFNETSINRPLKMNVGFEFSPFETRMIILSGMAGFGIRHPFTKMSGDTKFYPEYSFGARFSLAGAIKGGISTSYTDQLFSQQAALGLSIRIVEVNAGISTQSSTFKTSFQSTGLGAFINVAVGI